MNTELPDVSIVIPVYNRVYLLNRAIRSCLQHGCRVEVIVVDDGSEQEVQPSIEKAFSAFVSRTASIDSFTVRYMRQKNQGACVARNQGLAFSRGEYVKFLDSDDELLPTLAQELAAAKKSRADVVVTGWKECRDNADGHEDPGSGIVRTAPDLSNGIDDMLLRQGPWTSAALYRRDFIKNLRWDFTWKKAQDWGWALRVCLAGASFFTLDVCSSVYHHHGGARITSCGDHVRASTFARQDLLRMVETSLRRQRMLTPERSKLLAQYYYADRIMLCDYNSGAWYRLWRHCRELSPGFKPLENSCTIRFFTKVLGVPFGVHAYVVMKSAVKCFLGWARWRNWTPSSS